jgi:hypothetical protein
VQLEIMATNPLLPPRDENNRQSRQLSAVPPVVESDINILLPREYYKSFVSRLFSSLQDLVFPEKYPPLRLTSRPVNVILPVGEILRAPWYRTIFTNLGDVLAPENLPPLQLESRPIEIEELVSDITSEPWWRSLLRSVGDAISPEKLPPLELESTPVDVGELISDSSSRPWWKSLPRSLGDAISPEVLPELDLSSTPVNPGISEVGLVTPHWSSLISAPPASAIPRAVSAQPKAAHEVVMRKEARVPLRATEIMPVPLEALQVDADSIDVLVSQTQDSLSRSKRREVVWMSLASVEVIVLVALAFGWFR